MPVLALLIGIGGGIAFHWCFREVRITRKQTSRLWTTKAIAAALILTAIGIGMFQGWRSVEDWTAIHSGFNTQEREIVELARQAVSASGREGEPRVVCFGFSAPLYHYTRWPILDFFAHDETDIRSFLAAPGPHVLVLPEESMSTRWAGTPPGARWEWIRSTYPLIKQGAAGAFTVYVMGDP
jgi:hypothetical protein